MNILNKSIKTEEKILENQESRENTNINLTFSQIDINSLKIEGLKIGEILMQKGFISEEQLKYGLELQREKGGRIGRILLSLGYITRLDFFEAIALQLEKPFVSYDIEELIKQIDLKLLKEINHEDVIKYQAIPYKFYKDKLIILSAYPENEESLTFFKKKFNINKIEEWVITDLDIDNIVKKLFKNSLANLTVMGLFNRNPEESAFKRLTKPQVIVIIFSLLLIVSAFYVNSLYATIIVFSLIQIFYISSILFKLIISIVGVKNKFQYKKSKIILDLDIKDYPVYTVLIPLFREPEIIVKNLISSIKNIDYPQNKLDIILLFEEHDDETLEIAKSYNMPASWRFFVVPNGTPITKPKACNYGLYFSRGEYLVIYDAEDRPEPDQLKKALAAFRNSPDDYSCFQAYLNYYNSDENFLTKMFTLEYTYWFDYLLNGLQALKLPIPLGGTSNHFKTKDLKNISGWDPFNVTEDADLGVRFFAEGKRVGVINSTTYEEANCKFNNWIRQRSRWIKGYIQTAFVYNRHPIKMVKKLGLKNWLSFQMLITGTPVTFLINPILWITSIIWLTGNDISLTLPIVNLIGTITFIAGNLILILLNFMAVFSRKYYKLIPYTLLNPLYWVLHSIAAYKALWQFIFKPFYWEKTIHGLSSLNKD